MLGAVCGILLLIFGSGIGTDTQQEARDAESGDDEELSRYRAELEQEIKTLCESVKGVGNVTVVLTLSGGFCNVYATESAKDGAEEYVIVGSGSNAAALLLTRKTPEIVGIGIVCRNGSNASVKLELTALLSAAYNVSGNRIYVTEAKSSGL